MIINLIAGLVTGFLISIPPMGPIAFALISKGVHNEVKEGRAIAFGSGFMDFSYSLLAFSGLALIVSLFPSTWGEFYAAHASLIKTVLTFAACAFVMIYGLKIMKRKMAYNAQDAEMAAALDSAYVKAEKLGAKADTAITRLKIPVMKKANVFGSFFLGVLLCVTSLTLPASWIAIIGFLKGYHFLDSSFLGGLLFSLGAFGGTLVWYYTLLKLITGNKHRINETTVNNLNKIAGAILLGLGALLLLKAAISAFSLV
jgi:threonine/homoserine/homoserine lactone efflux protein